jgi:hypothetical protein
MTPYKTKKAKNEMVQGSAMFSYDYVLHHCPSRLGEKFQEIRDLASDQRREREEGLKSAGTDETKWRKWNDDEKAEVTEKLLATMIDLAILHGFDFAEPQPETRKRKRDVDEEDTPTKERYRTVGDARTLSAPTPPASAATSPRISDRPSRGVSPFSSSDERTSS